LKNKVLLINSNREVNPNPVLPVGMSYVASSLAKNGFIVACADLCFKKNWQSYLSGELEKFAPDFIGISIRNIDNHDQSSMKFYLAFVKEVIALCRLACSARIFCGGAALAVNPRAILNYLDLECGIFGDGEEATPELLRRWQSESDLSDLPGLVYRKNGQVFANAPRGIDDLDAVAQHELHRWIDVGPYFRQETSYPVQAKRGCPFDCIYCTYSKGEGKRYRLRSASAVAQEVVDIYKKYRPKTFEFVDSIFNHPPGFAEEICRELIKRKSRANLHTIEINPKFLTSELISLMEQAGFSSLGLTCESASERVLSNMKKDYGAEDVRAAARRLKNSKMKKLWVFLFGGPGEDEATVKETLRFAREQLGKNDVVFFNIAIRIYPGTEIEAIARREKLIDKKTDLLYPTFYLSPLIKRERIEELIRWEKNDRIVTIKDLNLPYLATLLRLYSYFRKKTPYWAYTSIFNRLRRNLCLK
jgi:radical SAM superfamily enzyme YgiQ (UPF0313 family)